MDDSIRMIAAAVVALSQLWLMEPWKFTAFARFWDWLARWTAYLANMLGWISVKARANYFQAVRESE